MTRGAMSFAAAVSLRAQQLQGVPVDEESLQEALQVIQAQALAPSRRAPRTLPRQLLALLANGPLARADFYAFAHQIYGQAGRSQGPRQRITQMLDEGWIVCEVRLTPKGRDKLGVNQ